MGKIILLYLSVMVWAKVDPPNYDFSLDTLKDFYVGKTLDEVEKKYGKGDFIKDNKGVQTKRFYVSHIRYKFPVFVQIANGQVVDFLARLPSYFLHDVFHQSLINRYGKQDLYFKRESNAVYVWNEKENMKMTYAGACTITCFPIYFTGTALTPPNGQAVEPLVQQFSTLKEN